MENKLTERQLKLLNVTCEVLSILNEYGIEDNNIEKLLKYDDADQDIGCLSDDLRIEFDLEEFHT